VTEFTRVNEGGSHQEQAWRMDADSNVRYTEFIREVLSLKKYLDHRIFSPESRPELAEAIVEAVYARWRHFR
jgi:hypothetical protein